MSIKNPLFPAGFELSWTVLDSLMVAASITFSAYLSVFLTLSNIETFWIPPKIPPKTTT
jgi:hypothetical protein